MNSFVYSWTDMMTDMVYLGAHKGSQDDGYICSSKPMMEEYNKRPNDFIRQIVATGSMHDMFGFEAILLNKLDAKNNKMFYNRHNGDGNFVFTGPHTESTKSKLRGPKSLLQIQHMKDNHADVNGVNNPMYGGAGGFAGKKHSSTTKNKMSISASGKIRTKSHSDNISKAKKGKPSSRKGCSYTKITCPHCGVVGGGGNMTRHHFDNCRGI